MILFVASDHIPHIGGKSTHILDLMSGIKSNESDSVLYSQGQYPKIKKYLLKFLISPVKLFNAKYFQYLYSLMWRKILAKKVYKLYKKNEPECISCQDAFAAASLLKYKNKVKCPIVLTMHTYFGLENSLDCKKSSVQERIYKKNMKFELESLSVVDKIVAVDDRILLHVEDTIRKEKNNREITVKQCLSIENFTNTDIFKPISYKKKKLYRNKINVNEDQFVIMCARRLVEKNGVIYAVKAMKYMEDDSLLIVAGNGPQKDLILETIKSEKLESKVKMIGDVQPKNIVKLYQLADCSVVPSVTVNGLQEATSISALEAMACGLPTVASEIGGLRQLIEDGKNGFLVNEKEPAEIADALKNLKNKDCRKQMSASARDFVVKKHSHIMGAKKYLNVFKFRNNM